MNRSFFNFGFSLLLHALVAMGVWRSSLRKSELPSVQEVEVKWVRVEPKPTSNPLHEHSKQKNKVSSFSRVKLSDLGLKLVSPAVGKVADIPPNEDNAVVDFKAENKNLLLNQAIFQAIDQNLAYPAELVEINLTGTVQANIAFSKEGEYLPEKTKINSGSNYLRVLVAQTLRHAFRDPIPKEKIKVSEDFSVDCFFKFELTEHFDAQKEAAQKMILKNHLAFYRSHVKSVLQWEMGPFHGFGPVPELDVLWLPNKIGEMFSKKAKIDPLDRYRDDPSWTL